VRTAHVVVLVKRPEQDAPARALAERLARELEGVKTAGEFVERAKALAVADLELRAERLPPVTADGRSFDPSNPSAASDQDRFDLDFAAAAHSLALPGDHSPVIKTRFGYHVILLEERIPEERVELEDRRRVLAREVFARRAKDELKKLLEQLHQRTAVDVSRAADELTAKVVISP
jgi:peptidyl-prolyl cis-trans isomerase C